MASTKLFSLVEMTVTGAPGTGSITLNAARTTDRLTFAEAGVGNGDTVSYVVSDGGNIEYGIGTYTSAGTSLSRDTVRKSKIGGVAGTTKVTLTASAIVWIDCAAEDLDVSDFTEDTSPSATADYWWMHDTSASTKKKVKPSNLTITATGGVTARTLSAHFGDQLYVEDFGAVGDGTTDDTTAIQAAIDASASLGVPINFAARTYKITNTINFTTSHQQIKAHGEVIIKHVASAPGTAVAIDAGSGSANLYGIDFGYPGKFTILGDANTSRGLFVRGVHHSRIRARVQDGGSSSAINVAFAVLSKFDITVSSNETAFSNKPAVGLRIDTRNAGEVCTDSEFDCVIEGVVNGIVINSGNGNIFRGTAESCDQNGVQESTSCFRNAFRNFHCEQNAKTASGGYDFYIGGTETILQNCVASSYNGTLSSLTLFATGGISLYIDGDMVQVLNSHCRNIQISALATDTTLINSDYLDAPNLGGFVDSGARTRNLGLREFTSVGSNTVNDRLATIVPNANDGGSLGISGTAWSDLFLASGGVINWNAGDVTITHSANTLAFGGASSGYTFDSLATITSTSANALAVGRQGSTDPVLKINASTASVATGISITGAAAASRAALAAISSAADEGLSIDAKGSGTVRLGATSTGDIEFSRNAVPTTTDGASLGTTSLMWSDAFLASGGAINWNNGTVTAAESSGTLTISTATSFGGLKLINTNADANAVPLILYRNSASPAVNDIIAQISFDGMDDAASERTYGYIQHILKDPSAASIDSQTNFVVTANNVSKILTYSGPASALHPNGTTLDLGAGLAPWSNLFLGSGNKIDFNNGDVTITHGTDVLTVAGGSIKLAAGTTAIAPLQFQAGTNLTTAADGAVEFDGQALFFSPDASDRRILPAIAITRLHAAYTLGNNTNVQKMFNASANGALTLPTGSYIFECLVGVDSMSGTSGNAALSIIGAGGATVANPLQIVVGIDGAKATAGAADGASWSVTNDVPAANTSVVTAGTSTEMAIMWKGSFEVTVAGTIIPSIDLITGAAAVVKIGSYFMCWRMGSATDVTQGNWS